MISEDGEFPADSPHSFRTIVVSDTLIVCALQSIGVKNAYIIGLLTLVPNIFFSKAQNHLNTSYPPPFMRMALFPWYWTAGMTAGHMTIPGGLIAIEPGIDCRCHGN
ncbi:hypothetical protein M5K25_001149 [Dendrobium thyrsiflorum]|uniref:Uncharacterized protein n=1 Tax=Dendrobium thyrsiflorum TaxID=117978 RepID=A0ABD0VW63_DENTH